MKRLVTLLITGASLGVAACAGSDAANAAANDRNALAAVVPPSASPQNAATPAVHNASSADAMSANMAASADDGDDSKIVIVNHSEQRIISFNIQNGDGWGSNYAERQIAPFSRREIFLDADSDDGCVIRTRIAFSGNQPDFEDEIDYCNKSYLNVGAQDVWAE